MSELSHLDKTGAARMVDVGDKPVTAREAVAEGRVRMAPETSSSPIPATAWCAWSPGRTARARAHTAFHP